MLAAAYHWRWIGSETALKEAKSAITRCRAVHRPMLRSGTPPLIAQEHAAWVVATELARAIARAAAAIAAPARKGRRAGLPVQPAGDLVHRRPPRRHQLGQLRDGHRPPAGQPDCREPGPHLDAWPGARITGHRHRDRKTKARLGFPPPGAPHAHRTSPDQRLRHHSGLTSRRPRSRAVTTMPAVEPAAAPERHPGHRHALTQRHHPPVGKDRRAHPRSCATKWHWDLT